MLLRGAWVQFANRADKSDPRPPIGERYASKEAYLAKVKDVLQSLIAQRFLSDDDLEPQLKQAGERWDWVTK